jgi:MFS family permease
VQVTLAPLGVGGYRRLLVSYVVNELGDALAAVALAVLVWDRSHSAFATAGFFLAAKFLPALAAPALVARVDQLAVRRVLPVLYGLEAVLFGALALLVHHYSYPAVEVLALLDGALALTARAVTRGVVAALLAPAGLLREGNALMNIGFGTSAVVGTALGGIVVSSAGLVTALVIEAGSFALVALVAAGLAAVAPDHEEREAFGVRLRGGFAHVRGHPLLRPLLLGQALALVFFYLIVPIEVVYAKRTLAAGDAGFGALLAFWSAGILFGSLGFLRLRRRSAAALVILSTAAVGLAYGGLALAEALWVACALSVLGGIGNGFQWVSVMTLLQEATPLELQARVAGLLESVGALTPGVGFLLGGALTALLSARAAYAVAGIGVLVVVSGFALVLPSRAANIQKAVASSGGA